VEKDEDGRGGEERAGPPRAAKWVLTRFWLSEAYSYSLHVSPPNRPD